MKKTHLIASTLLSSFLLVGCSHKSFMEVSQMNNQELVNCTTNHDYDVFTKDNCKSEIELRIRSGVMTREEYPQE